MTCNTQAPSPQADKMTQFTAKQTLAPWEVWHCAGNRNATLCWWHGLVRTPHYRLFLVGRLPVFQPKIVPVSSMGLLLKPAAAELQTWVFSYKHTSVSQVEFPQWSWVLMYTSVHWSSRTWWALCYPVVRSDLLVVQFTLPIFHLWHKLIYQYFTSDAICSFFFLGYLDYDSLSLPPSPQPFSEQCILCFC